MTVKQKMKKKLDLSKTTIAVLTTTEMRNAIGGALPETRNTRCGTQCEYSNSCD